MDRPFYVLHRLFALLIVASLLMACNKQPTEPSLTYGTETYDTTAIHLALVPNRDCLPLYYAKRHGIFESLGVKVQVVSYRSQMDCDTALLGHVTDGGWADYRRLAAYPKQNNLYRRMWSASESWPLFVNGQLRMNKLADLKGRTVAVPRQCSESDALVQLLLQAKMKADDVYCAQINDLCLRTEMLSHGQVDAALLCWPYTSFALSQGNRMLSAGPSLKNQAGFVMKSDLMKQSQWKARYDLLERGRRMAIDSLRMKGPKAYSLVLQRDYGLPKEVADTIKYLP